MELSYSDKKFPSDETIRSTLTEAFQEQVGEIIPVNKGSVNKSLVFRTHRCPFFCKISPYWYKGSLKREAWCLQLLKGLELNVPSVIKLIDNERVEILVLEFINGPTLSECYNPPSNLEQIVQVYKEMHGVKMENFGWLDADMKGLRNSWLDFLVGVENIELISKSPYWKKRKEYVMEQILKLSMIKVDPVLLYGDYNKDNFIQSKKGLVAIDFQNCFSGDSLYDWGIIIAKETRARNYIFPLLDSREIKIVYLYAMRYLLSMLTYTLLDKNYSRLSFVRSKFNLIKGLYESN